LQAKGSGRGVSTVAIRGGRTADIATGAILTPICQSTTYVQSAIGQHKGHTYSRASNPTVEALEQALAALECGEDRECRASCYATGMAAITTLFLATLKAGDHVVLSNVLYGGTVRLASEVLEPLGVRVTFVDATQPQNVERAIGDTTKLVFIETPANPTLVLTDVEAIARITRARGVLLAVDNTFLTPVLLRPLDLGADVSVYSTTKYIEGHNATVGGALCTRNQQLDERLRRIRKTIGCIQAPFEAWLTLRGLKTLPLRIREHSRSAQKVAEWLAKHPLVAKVSYPGLRQFSQRELALRQHRDQSGSCYHGGIVSFELTGGETAGRTLMEAVRLCSLAENLGAAETLITHPVSMTHGDVPRQQRESTGITDGLVRLSVGLEDVQDIINDLAQALDAVASSAS
jgi:cystathionine beta-lyase/cystathionine gamma-synthase